MNIEMAEEVLGEHTPRRSWRSMVGLYVGMLGVSLVLAIVMVLGWTWYQHWQGDHLNHHVMTEIMRYNVDQGRLLIPPALQEKPAAPSPSPSPTPAPPATGK